MTERHRDALSGVLAIGAGLCWLAWALGNTLTSRRLEHAAAGSTAATASGLLTAGWNLLLIPAAFRLYHHFRQERDGILLAATLAGAFAMALWGIGGLTQISRRLETSYLAFGAVWLLVLGLRAVGESRSFGSFTLALAAFTALDAIFNLLEPLPFALYVLAAPKLPLAAVWSVTAGLFLIRSAGRATPGRRVGRTRRIPG
jgi:hypothetical protein